MRWTRIAAEIALCAGVLGCSRDLPAPVPAAHPEQVEPHRGETIRFATFADLKSLDPANIADGVAPSLDEQVYAGLVDYDFDGKVVPDLAEGWTVEDEGLTYRFTLRRGARFHDGDEVTAEDIRRSTERALHASAPNPYASYFVSIEGAAEFAAGRVDHIAGVHVDGRYVVSYHLRERDGAFLRLLAMQVLRPVCKSAGDRYLDTWHPCGAGPFKLPPGGWDPGREITLVRHDGYFGAPRPWVDAIHWTLHQTVLAQNFKFASAELDVLREFLPPELLRYRADPRWTDFGAYEPEKLLNGEAMNVEMPPFDNPEIRKAIAAAVDRDELSKLRRTTLRPASQPIPPGVFGHDPNLVGQRFDYEAALEHMRRAGYPYDPVTKKGGWPRPIPYLVYDQGLFKFTGQVLAQQLARIGINIELRIVNYPTFITLRNRRHEVAFGPFPWQPDFPDAGGMLEPMYHSRSISETDSNNWSFYKNPAVDDLIDRGRRTLDEGERKKIYSEASRIICEDAPSAYTTYYRWYIQRQPYVRGYRPHSQWVNDVRDTWIDRASSSLTARSLFSRSALGAIFRSPR